MIHQFAIFYFRYLWHRRFSELKTGKNRAKKATKDEKTNKKMKKRKKSEKMTRFCVKKRTKLHTRYKNHFHC